MKAHDRLLEIRRRIEALRQCLHSHAVGDEEVTHALEAVPASQGVNTLEAVLRDLLDVVDEVECTAPSASGRAHEESGSIRPREGLEEGCKDRVRVEEDMARSECQYRRLVELSLEAILVFHQEKIILANNAARRLLGVTDPHGLLGSCAIDLVHPAHRDRDAQTIRSLMEGLGDSPFGEFELVGLDGETITIEISVIPFLYRGKAVVQWVIRDLSERRRTEEELLQARDSAEITSRAKSEFLANMSHELRTPLNAIVGFTELLVDQKLGDLNAIQEEYLGYVLQSSHHLLSLINDILDLAKVEAGKLQLDMSRVKLKDLILGSLVMIKEKAMRHNIRVTTDIEPAFDLIMAADERKLKQIMYNLLANAVKFTPDNGRIQVSVRVIDASIPPVKAIRYGHGEDVSEESPGGGTGLGLGRGKLVEVSVSDSGIGVKPEDLDRIFNPFEQADGTLARRYQGTGLGLSLTRRLVELHGGAIWADSKGPGQGSTFRFVLPVSGNDSDGLPILPLW